MTIAPAVFCALNQPSPSDTDGVSWAGGSVEIEPVGVYVGRAAYKSPATPDSVAGGHGKDADTLGGIVPAPAPPVCHAEYVPAKGVCPALSALHFPTLVRGSVGIQPLLSPSWYDHKGDSTLPDTEEGPTYRYKQGISLTLSNLHWRELRPTFHVQNHQFCSASMLARVKSRIPCFTVAFQLDESIQNWQVPSAVAAFVVAKRNKPQGLYPLLNSPEKVTPNAV